MLCVSLTDSNPVSYIQGRRWTSQDKGVALGVYYRSRQVYELLGELFTLPSASTLERFVRGVPTTPGISDGCIKLLEKKVQALNDISKVCILTFDEMALRKELKYNAAKDDVQGLVQLPEKKPVACNQALVFMLKGLAEKWKQPLAFYFSENAASAKHLQTILKELMMRISSIGLKLVAIVCDQGSCNRALYRLLGVDVEKPFIEFQERRVYALYDVPHILKNIRNTLKKSPILYDNGKVASWNDVVSFYKADQALPHFARLAPRLTAKHIYLPPFSPMKVSLAAQVCSHTVYAGMHTMASLGKLPPSVTETANFLKEVNDVFDLLNARKKGDGVLTTERRASLKKCVLTVDRWKPSGSSSQPPCFLGLKQTLKGMDHLAGELLAGQFDYILTGRITQDCLESFFSQVRAKGGHRFNPSAREFAFAYRALSTNLLLKPVKSANCKSDSDDLLLSLGALGKEQPKRKRDQTDEDKTVEPLAKVPKVDCCIVEGIEDFVVPTILSNIVAYIAGYVLKKIGCNDCSLTEVDSSVISEANVFCHLKAYTHDTSAFGSLTVPSDSFRRFLERVDKIFVAQIPDLICTTGILSNLMENVKTRVPLVLIEKKLCDKHSQVRVAYVASIVRLYLRCRIHYYFKYETNKLLQTKSKKNRKAQVLTNS